MKRYILPIIFILMPLFLMAQDYQGFYQKSLNINQTGMYVLGGWALANIASGAYGWNKSDGSSRYFHQMNLFWNSVNITIAGIGLYSAITSDPYALDATGILSEQRKSENIYLINAGLDILYMGAGYYMTWLSDKKTKSKDLLKGYGQSVILQGAFLFVFDLVMYAIQRHHHSVFTESLAGVQLTPNSLSLVFSF